MSTSVASVTNHYPSPQNGFTTTLASSIASAATTVPLNSVAGYTNGQIGVFVIDPADTTKKQTFTGVIDTSGVQVTSAVWTAGTNQTHTAGATVVDYATATHIAMITKGLLAAGLTQAGGMGAISPTSVTSSGNITAANFIQTGGASANGWTVGLTAPNTVTANGNRSYSLVVNSTDLTSQVSPGMRLRFTRTVSAPTQCTSLNGTTQFYSKTSPAGMTFTNNFVVSAWIKATSFSASETAIASRYNGTSGWDFYLDVTGRVSLIGHNAAGGNYKVVQSYQSVPLNKWVHVAAQLDMTSTTNSSTVNYVMIDGVDVPAFQSSGGTAPTALIQAGNLEIGSRNAGVAPFAGKIAQVAIYSAKVTQANVLATMAQGLAGNETSLISAYSFSNSIADLNANANNLTANGSAVATATDSPFSVNSFGTATGTTDYGIITSATFSTNTTLVVQVPEANTIPTTGGVSAVAYSLQKIPYGFPGQHEKWVVGYLNKTDVAQASPVSGTWYNPNSQQLNVPIGSWRLYWEGTIYGFKSSTIMEGGGTLSTANNSESDQELSVHYVIEGASATVDSTVTYHREKYLSVVAATPYYLNLRSSTASANTIDFRGDLCVTLIYAECAYL